MLTKLRMTVKLPRWPEIPSWETSRGHECGHMCDRIKIARHEINGSTKLLLARQILSSLLSDTQKQPSVLDCGFKIVRKRRNTVQDVKSCSPSSKTQRRRSSGFARPDHPATSRRPSGDLSEQDYVLQVSHFAFCHYLIWRDSQRRTISSRSPMRSTRINN